MIRKMLITVVVLAVTVTGDADGRVGRFLA